MIRFDAYTATLTGAKPQDLYPVLLNSGLSDHVTLSQGRGFHTFGERLAFKVDGIEFGALSWGGRQGDRVMFEVKGERSPDAVERLRSAFPHRVTRADACADFDRLGAFEELLRPCMQVKKAHKLKGNKAGDWEDFPEDGRTLYLGAAASAVRVRLYEKGKQPEYQHLGRPNWARIEVQARPAKEAKEAYATLSPVEVWGASSWTRDLAAKVLREHVDPHPAGTVYRLSEREAAIRWMCKQYGAHLVGLAGDLGGWKEVGLTLMEVINEQKRSDRGGV